MGEAAGAVMAEFRALGLAPWLAEQARQVGLSRPTPVQAACIPPVLQGERAWLRSPSRSRRYRPLTVLLPPSLAGRDCLGCAKTGSGKTAAFVLPVLQVLSEDPYGIFCLVLTPTRYRAAPLRAREAPPLAAGPGSAPSSPQGAGVPDRRAVPRPGEAAGAEGLRGGGRPG